ncbi:hypothetical protein [Laceyella putida]|uniref:Uncharacterized protein n=1 Tax=Laceyella putida TaxID=110101 RepID=A0ABW2RR93_9BACL
MPVNYTIYPLTIVSGDTAETEWIDISTYVRCRLVVAELPDDPITGLKPQYEVSISQSSVADTGAPVIVHGTKYTCGVNMYDEYYAQSEIFDPKVEFGAKFIKIQLLNRRGTTSVDAYLIYET